MEGKKLQEERGNGNELTAWRRGLTLQEALSTEGLAEHLRERRRQLTGRRHQLQSPERTTTEDDIGLQRKHVKTFVSLKHVLARRLTEEL